MSTKRESLLTAKFTRFVEGKQYWLFLATVYGFARIPTWFFPYDSDHWIFYYVGRKWLDGAVLYLQVWDHKSPLIFAINGGIHRVLSDNIILHRIFLTGVSVLAIWLFYLVTLRLFKQLDIKNHLALARIGTLIFTVWVNLSQFTNSGNNTENFGVPALLFSVYMYLRWKDDKHYKWLLYSGTGISVLVFLKINFVILLIPLIIDFVITIGRNLKRLFILGSIWIAPLFAQALLWYSYFAPRDLLNEWWIAMVEFNSKYLGAGWAGNLSGQLIFLMILAVAALFFAGAYFNLVRETMSKKSKLPGIIISIGGSALIFSIILGTFYSHYYLIVIPYLAILIAYYWEKLTTNRLVIALMIIGLAGSLIISYKQLYNSLAGSAAADYSNMEKAARTVNELTDGNDTIFFYGYGATFYQLAERDSGSRYISASHLLIDERENFGYNFTDKFIGDMLVSEPKYVIFDPATIDLYSENEKAMQFFENHYQTEMMIAGYELLRIKK